MFLYNMCDLVAKIRRTIEFGRPQATASRVVWLPTGPAS